MLRSEIEIMKNWEGDKDSPLLSICCVAYNHENYINEALDGFLLQETDFPFEIIVRDDASDDNTAEVIKQYKKKFPNIIKPIYETTNQYTKGVRPMPVTFKKALGKYLALCDGDDYWIDKNKLQKQVDFLEKNKSYSMVCTNVEIIDNLGFVRRKRFEFENNFDIDIEYLLKNNHITTSTSMVVSSKLKLRKSIKLNFGDKHFWLTLLQNGRCLYLNDVTARYRMHSTGIYSSLKEYSKSIKRIEDYNIYRKEFPSLYKKITIQIYKHLLKGVISSLKHRKYKEFKRLLKLVF